MFLNYLKENQKVLFLILAEELIKADDKVLLEEKELFCSLQKEMDVSEYIPGKKISFEELDLSVFDTNESRNTVVLELVALAYVDENFSKEEKVFIKKVMKEFLIPEKEIKIFEKWVLKQKSLYEEASLIITSNW
ncbi:MAG: hypothetical protein AB1403_04195 [Candidatus Riflebacteria bacterium]